MFVETIPWLTYDKPTAGRAPSIRYQFSDIRQAITCDASRLELTGKIATPLTAVWVINEDVRGFANDLEIDLSVVNQGCK
ncbi:hypothetical protein [Bradyrhizobium sp. 145]|uniref:hypothetical protein n=1 Tax=Bradyrhizobium sp. 145 TaxID=2782621 RepID=UPI001FFA5D2A|nr:hypothetical protein [Bradyrhizobium sp. 145]MCK1688313.1 hypothetical protein [Bradyrhizobium sp. 145]